MKHQAKVNRLRQMADEPNRYWNVLVIKIPCRGGDNKLDLLSKREKKTCEGSAVMVKSEGEVYDGGCWMTFMFPSCRFVWSRLGGRGPLPVAHHAGTFFCFERHPLDTHSADLV